MRRILLKTEEIIYYGVALFLILVCGVLFFSIAGNFFQAFLQKELASRVIGILSDLLLVLMLAEILYTVRISLTEHILTSEPFLIVGLIAAIRRVLVITVEIAQPDKIAAEVYQKVILEIGILTILILVMAVSLFLLKKTKGV